jgi:hypothetical protein
MEVELIYFRRKRGKEDDIITMRFKVPKTFDLRSDIDALQLFQSIRFFKELSNKIREELLHKYVERSL